MTADVEDPIFPKFCDIPTILAARARKSSYSANYCRLRSTTFPHGIGYHHGKLFLQVYPTLSHRQRNANLLACTLHTIRYRTSFGVGRQVRSPILCRSNSFKTSWQEERCLLVTTMFVQCFNNETVYFFVLG